LRHAGIGLVGGAASAFAVTLLPALTPLAHYEAAPDHPFDAASLAFIAGAMLFGAIGEELLFHGYAFQLLLAHFGAFTTLLPVGVLFAAAHSNNLASSPWSLFNTFLWGVFLGFCFLRAGDLWLPVGIHYGWNLALSLAGAEVSGFQMSATGYRLVWDAPAWVGGGAYGPEGGVLCTVVLLGLVYAIYRAPIDTQVPGLLRQRLSSYGEE
jgi:membrane protease YdiL (CAAX protease family)